MRRQWRQLGIRNWEKDEPRIIVIVIVIMIVIEEEETK